MTRINLVDPRVLTDQHLIAEYRELFMVAASLKRSLRSPRWSDARIPKQFTLGKGHVMFFYDKGRYLQNRYAALIHEMRRRGFRPDPKRKFRISDFPKRYRNDWQPKRRDMRIIKARIQQRLSERPGFYRKHGVPLRRKQS